MDAKDRLPGPGLFVTRLLFGFYLYTDNLEAGPRSVAQAGLTLHPPASTSQVWGTSDGTVITRVSQLCLPTLLVHQ